MHFLWSYLTFVVPWLIGVCFVYILIFLIRNCRRCFCGVKFLVQIACSMFILKSRKLSRFIFFINSRSHEQNQKNYTHKVITVWKVTYVKFIILSSKNCMSSYLLSSLLLCLTCFIIINAYFNIFKANHVCVKNMQGTLRIIPNKSRNNPLMQIEQVIIEYENPCYHTC